MWPNVPPSCDLRQNHATAASASTWKITEDDPTRAKSAIRLLTLGSTSPAQQACVALKGSAMNTHVVNTSIEAQLAQIRIDLEKGLRIAKAAEICARAGRINKGVEIALSLEAIVHELNTSLNATNMIKRLGKT